MLRHLLLKLQFSFWLRTLFLRESILTVVVLLGEYKEGITVRDSKKSTDRLPTQP